MSQKFIITFLKIPLCMAIVTHDKWMTEWFPKPCVLTLKECITFSYLPVLKLKNYSSKCSSHVFFRIKEVKLFSVIEAINEATATNSVMNYSHTFYFIAGAKAFCFILYSSESFQVKIWWVWTLSSVTLSWQKPEYLEGSDIFKDKNFMLRKYRLNKIIKDNFI